MHVIEISSEKREEENNKLTMISNSKRIEADMSHHVCTNIPIEQLIKEMIDSLSKVNKRETIRTINLQKGGGRGGLL